MRGSRIIFHTLALAITLSGAVAFIPTGIAQAQTQTDSGDINISSFVSGPPPTSAPTIDSPTNNDTFKDKNITVEGDCISGLIVKVFRNNMFSGSALCDSSGRYTLPIDLFQGRNDLVARQYDLANQDSPDSDTITVFFIPESTSPELPTSPVRPTNPVPPSGSGDEKPPVVANFQLVIDYDYTFQGVFQNKPFALPLSFSGGNGPYALSIDWGDGESSLFSREDTTRFTPTHTYTGSGFRTVVIKVSDSEGEEAIVQFVILVNGANSSPVTRQLFGSQVLAEQWPLVVVPSVLGGIAIGAIAAAGITAFIVKRRLGPPSQ